MPHALKTWIADAARSRAIDRRAAEEYGLLPRILMERAGLAVYEALKQMLPGSGRVAVICGKGNNGGDGFVLARLAREGGYCVECLVSHAEHELGEEAHEQARIARAQGLRPIFGDDARYARKLEELRHHDIIVDALLGTGATGELKDPVLGAVQAINGSGVPVLAVDVPSGIDTNTGEEMGESVWALRTVVLGLPKPFLFQGIGLEHAGHWSVADIGLPPALLDEPTGAKLMDRDWVGSLIPERLRASHKGDNGRVIIIAGSHRMRGAAVLSARAALGAGAGLVMVAGIDSVCDAVSAQLPEAMVIPLPERDGTISPSAVETVLEEMARCRAAVLGPGLSLHAGPFLERLFPFLDIPTVIDADALTALASSSVMPRCECVLTPHPGEMSRLMHASIAEIQVDRFASVRRAVDRFQHTVLLKGPYTLVGDPDQPMLVNPTGNPGLATGGTGDVLSGIVGTLLAQDLPGYYAAACAVYWHGAAADLAAKHTGPVGYLAGDVAAALPAARRLICEAAPTC